MVADLLDLLEVERRELVRLVESVPVERRQTRPSAVGWSVAEVLEHLATVERGVAKLLVMRGREEPKADEQVAVPLDEARIARLRGRAEPIEAPERVRPTGSVPAADALAALEKSRAALCDAVGAAHPAALARCTYLHPVLGLLTLEDWVRFIAHHEARHAAQVRDIAASLDRL